jgi:hypothetical protein
LHTIQYNTITELVGRVIHSNHIAVTKSNTKVELVERSKDVENGTLFFFKKKKNSGVINSIFQISYFSLFLISLYSSGDFRLMLHLITRALKQAIAFTNIISTILYL